MNFFDWFRVKPKVAAKIDTPYIRPAPLGLMHFAKEVLAKTPLSHTFTPETLVALVERSSDGSYIKVGKYPAGMERDDAKLLIGRTISWARWPAKFDGMASANRLLPYYQLRVGPQACPAAMALAADIIPLDQVTRTPMDDCWDCACQCWYKSLSDRQAAQLIARG